MSLDYTDKADTDTDTYNKAPEYYSEEQRARFKQILEEPKISNIMRLKIELDNLIKNIDDKNNNPSSGGKKKVKPVKPAMNGKKEILGKQRCIYKKAGDRKEYVKYKGALITVKDYKKIMKDVTVKRNKK